jgi:flagellar biosynthesis protein FlhG
MLGVTRGRGGLNKVIDRKIDTVAEALTPTGIEGLWMLAGDRASPGTANLSYARKQRIIRQISQLQVDHVVMDLGAGTALNVLDFFLAADTGVVVVVPEPTSIENTYDFLLAAFLRSLRSVSRESGVREALDAAIAAHRGQIPGPRDLLAAVQKEDEAAGVALQKCFERFSAQLVVNRIRNARHNELGPQIVRDAAAHLGARLRYSGAITADDCVVNAVINGKPVIERFPGSQFAHHFGAVVERLLAGQSATAEGTDRAPEASAAPRPTPTPVAAVPQPIEQPSPLSNPAEATPLAQAPVKAPAASPGEPGKVDLEAPGLTLRRRREQLGLSLEECLGRTRIRCLVAIEAEDLDHLPPELYLRSFVAQYAMLLRIEQAPALANAYIERVRGARPSADRNFTTAATDRGQQHEQAAASPASMTENAKRQRRRARRRHSS